MIYEFTDKSGNIVEITMTMACAPAIGTTITHEGKKLTRIASTSVQLDSGANRSQYPYVSTALPRNLAGCKSVGGKPLVESKRHERNIMSQHGFEKD